MERPEADSNKFKGNEGKLVNPNILRFSCASGMMDDNIPEWLLLEVLVRLPVKSVFRFKLVSRRWLSMISDPYFVRVYVSRGTLLSPRHWTILFYRVFRKTSQFSYLDYKLLKDLHGKPSFCVVGLPSVHASEEEDVCMIRAVSNGLVLYMPLPSLRNNSGYADHNCYICNPLTGHSIALPPFVGWINSCGWGFHTYIEDGFLKSYRVVGIEPPIDDRYRTKFLVYISETSEWKNFIVPVVSPVYVEKEATVLNGIMHWIVRQHGIIAYDPYKNPQNMRVIVFPDDSVQRSDLNTLCAEYREKLRYFEMVKSEDVFPSFKIWVLNDYSSADWSLQHNISHVDVQYDANFPSRGIPIGPECFDPCDSDIVYLGCDDYCISYNIKTRKLQVEDEFYRPNFPDKWWVSSFLYVIPHWPTSVPRPSYGAVEC